jgi:putative phosphoribosyl transferase
LIAEALHAAGLGTFSVNLLAPEEVAEAKVVDIQRLADRLHRATDWLKLERRASGLPVGYFAQGHLAATALAAASRQPETVAAVVSYRGQPHLAWDSLFSTRAPSLFIADAADNFTVDMNQKAIRLLRCPKELILIPNDTSALEEVCDHAKRWFLRHLA